MRKNVPTVRIPVNLRLQLANDCLILGRWGREGEEKKGERMGIGKPFLL